MLLPLTILIFFFFNDTATTEIYTLSLHDALPIFAGPERVGGSLMPLRRTVVAFVVTFACALAVFTLPRDRKSTRLNSSHLVISYAVFCLKKKNLRCRRRWTAPLARLSPSYRFYYR